MSFRQIEAVGDPTKMIADLEGMWEEFPPTTYDGKPLKPMLGSAYDQAPTTQNPYWDIVRLLPLDRSIDYYDGSGHATQVDGYARRVGRDYLASRDQLCKTYAYAIPTPDDLVWLASTLDGRGVVEIGTGTGYWAWQLHQAGVDVLAVDEFPGEANTFCGPTQYHPVLQAGPRTAKHHPDRALMLCWPPYGHFMAAQSLEHYTGDLLIYIGEPSGGCTADDDFFEMLEKDWDHLGHSPRHVTYAGIHCYVEAYARKGASA